MFLLDHATYCPPDAARTTIEELVSSWERLTHLSEFRVSTHTWLLGRYPLVGEGVLLLLLTLVTSEEEELCMTRLNLSHLLVCLQFSDPKNLKSLLEFGKVSGVASRCIPPNLVRSDGCCVQQQPHQRKQ